MPHRLWPRVFVCVCVPSLCYSTPLVAPARIALDRVNHLPYRAHAAANISSVCVCVGPPAITQRSRRRCAHTRRIVETRAANNLQFQFCVSVPPSSSSSSSTTHLRISLFWRNTDVAHMYAIYVCYLWSCVSCARAWFEMLQLQRRCSSMFANCVVRDSQTPADPGDRRSGGRF